MKTFKSLSHAERTKINKFHSIHYDMNVLDAAVKQLMSNPDPDFIRCLASKFSTFIDTEVLPLSELHCKDMLNSHLANLEKQNHENENKENPNYPVEDN